MTLRFGLRLCLCCRERSGGLTRCLALPAYLYLCCRERLTRMGVTGRCLGRPRVNKGRLLGSLVIPETRNLAVARQLSREVPPLDVDAPVA